MTHEAPQNVPAATTDYPLSVPINAHGQQTDTLHLRRPSTAEVRKIGRLPYVLVDDQGKFTPQIDVVAQYLVVCAGIPPSAVDQLDLHDLNQLAWVVCGFFMTAASSASSS